MADRMGSLADPSTYDDDPYAALQAYAGSLPPDQPAPGDTHQPYVNPIARGSMTDVLTGLGGGERYQTFPERLARGALGIPAEFLQAGSQAYGEAQRMANPGAYTQSSDVTPEDRMVAQTLPATFTLGAGAPAMAERGALGAFGGRMPRAPVGEAPMGSVADVAAYKAPAEAEAPMTGPLRAWAEPPQPQPQGPVLLGDPRFRGSFNPLDEQPFTFNGKNPNQWTPEEFKQAGDAFGVPNLGPLSPLQTFKDAAGRDITIPGGLNDKFTYYDLLHLKAQGINAADLPMDLHVPLQQKIMRTMTPELPSSDAQNWSGLMFGMTSPNNPLFPNQLAQSRLRLRDPEMMGQLANMIPWKAGETVPKDVRNAASDAIASQFGLNAASQGGLGVRGSQNYTYPAELAQMFQKDPGFFRKGADEPWSQFVERLSSQVPGLQMKTGSFGSVWQNPAQAGISAVDRHMVNEFEKTGGLFPTPEAQSAFEQQAVNRWNNATPERAVNSFDQLQQQSGYPGFRNKMLLEYVGNAPDPLFRLKSGDINPTIPQHLQDAPWVVEPRRVQTMSEPYQRALDWNAQQAAQQGLPLFPSQWLMWDRIRNRLEPHENMFPGLENMPAMSRDQLREVVAEHNASGHMAYTKTPEGNLRPTKPWPNPARFGYFAAPAAIGLGGALYDQGDQEEMTR